jgi:hypothetical protein
LPAVIPVQSTVPSYNTTQLGPVEAGTASLSAESDRLMNELQNQYAQQFNNLSTQSKVLQDQVQTLSARVATMETQLNQLVQALTQRNQANTPSAMPAAPVEHHASEPKIGYSVQAIIPGRAWLKSDNGETVTVAEGDVIRDVGRVTKIDPYDGVVEINVNGRTASLSYGNGS